MGHSGHQQVARSLTLNPSKPEETSMLTDTTLRNLKPESKIYEASDRDGMYVTVSPSGTVPFRYGCRFNGRRETLTLGRHGPDGISLAMARCSMPARALGMASRPRWRSNARSAGWVLSRSSGPHVGNCGSVRLPSVPGRGSDWPASSAAPDACDSCSTFDSIRPLDGRRVRRESYSRNLLRRSTA